MSKIRRVMRTEYCGGCCDGHSHTIGYKHDDCNILMRVQGTRRPKMDSTRLYSKIGYIIYWCPEHGRIYQKHKFYSNYGAQMHAMMSEQSKIWALMPKQLFPPDDEVKLTTGLQTYYDW